jgi:magnesium chelatase family protein
MRSRYRARISGPLLDRFDLVVAVGRVEAGEYSGASGEPTSAVAARVARAREAQKARGTINRRLDPARSGQETGPALSLVSGAVGAGLLTARGADRVRRVARTIADLEESEPVEEHHMAEAIGLRGEWRDE